MNPFVSPRQPPKQTPRQRNRVGFNMAPSLGDIDKFEELFRASPRAKVVETSKLIKL